MDPYKRIRLAPGSTAALMAALALTWGPFVLDPSGGPVVPVAQSLVLVTLVVGAVACPRAKVAVVRAVQRRVLNPVVMGLHRVGLNPLGLVVLETRGRVSGLPRRTPVGNGRVADSLWIVAEHGLRANWVRNVLADPHVQVRIRRGLHYRWESGIATVLPHDDVLARQRAAVGWHPLRALNAMTVRLMGADLVTVHVALGTGPEVEATTEAGRPQASGARSL